MKCIYCHPELQGKNPKVRIEHKRCSEVPIKDNVIKEYEVSS